MSISPLAKTQGLYNVTMFDKYSVFRFISDFYVDGTLNDVLYFILEFIIVIYGYINTN